MIFILNFIEEINLALNKPASQSSDWSDCCRAEKAFDGNKNQLCFTGGYCNHTGKQANSWLEIDLIRKAWIKKLIIYNRNDAGFVAARFKSADVFVADSLDMIQNKQLCVYIAAITTPTQIQTFECMKYIVGRYVRIQLRITEFLHLCEVEILGTYYLL